MKRYHVVDGHTGDKSYAAGDTRIADPASVTHLVSLGVLTESENQDDLDDVGSDASDEGGFEVTVLHEQIEFLTQERDEAARLHAVATQEADASRIELTALREQIEILKQEQADSVALGTENETLRAQVQSLTAEMASAHQADAEQSQPPEKAELPLANKMETSHVNKGNAPAVEPSDARAATTKKAN